MDKRDKQSIKCPCGSKSTYYCCCQRYHKGEMAPNPEALMRSRYSAYVLCLENYLLATWHPETRPQMLNLEADSDIKWLGLKVIAFQMLNEKNGIVEFEASYKVKGNETNILHEISRFEILERWHYHSGTY